MNLYVIISFIKFSHMIYTNSEENSLQLISNFLNAMDVL